VVEGHDCGGDDRVRRTLSGNTAKAVALEEAGFKVRTITPGSLPRDVLLSQLQGHMIRRWKESGYSTMLTEDADLANRVSRHNKSLQALLEVNGLLEVFGPDGSDPCWWNSGDFSAATDNLKMAATHAAVQGSVEAFPRLGPVALASFLPARIKYPVLKVDDEGAEGGFTKVEIPDGYMEEGQLMGHPLSFPLLCVINLSAFLVALDRWRETLVREGRWLDGFEEVKAWLARSVMINGDDVACKMPTSLYPIWAATCRDVGLIPSVGKNYFSPDCVQINSQMFKEERKSGLMRRQHYLNQRLVTGQSVKAGDSFASPTEVARELNRICNPDGGTPWIASCIPEAMSRWADKSVYEISGKSVGSRVPIRPNWYLPVHMGGIGLDIRLATADTFITRPQRLLARNFLSPQGLGATLYLMKGGTKSTLAAKVLSDLRAVDRVYGDYVPNANQNLSDLDGAFERMTLYARFGYRADPMSLRQLSQSTLATDWRKSVRPVTVEEIAAHWRCQLFYRTDRLPPFPPLPPITDQNRAPELPPEVLQEIDRVYPLQGSGVFHGYDLQVDLPPLEHPWQGVPGGAFDGLVTMPPLFGGSVYRGATTLKSLTLRLVKQMKQASEIRDPAVRQLALKMRLLFFRDLFISSDDVRKIEQRGGFVFPSEQHPQLARGDLLL